MNYNQSIEALCWTLVAVVFAVFFYKHLIAPDTAVKDCAHACVHGMREFDPQTSRCDCLQSP